MSETEHHEGKLTPTGQTVDQFMADWDEPKYGTKVDYFHEELTEQAKEINGIVYVITRVSSDGNDSIFKSSKNEDGSINFEVKFYNGGCGFGEALDDALVNCK